MPAHARYSTAAALDDLLTNVFHTLQDLVRSRPGTTIGLRLTVTGVIVLAHSPVQGSPRPRRVR
jgi:hypothetical protein